MQEQKDGKVISLHPPNLSPPDKLKLSPAEEKLVALIAKIIVDKTINDLASIPPAVDSSTEKEYN